MNVWNSKLDRYGKRGGCERTLELLDNEDTNLSSPSRLRAALKGFSHDECNNALGSG